jgi:hypothetical protein
VPAYERRMQVALWASLAVPSVFVVHKYGGWLSVLIYVVLSAGAVAVAPRVPLPRSPRARLNLALGIFALLIVLFVIVYPIVNSQQPGMGSDDDDAYNLGVRALLAGRSPYAETTYLGNVLHQFAGAFVLAAPFVVLFGTSAWQNLFWMGAFYLTLRRTAGDDRPALRVIALLLVACPVVVHQVLTGTAHLSNALYVLLGLWYLVQGRHVAPAAVAWGIALASRANFLFLVPLAFGWLARSISPTAHMPCSLCLLSLLQKPSGRIGARGQRCRTPRCSLYQSDYRRRRRDDTIRPGQLDGARGGT